MAVSHSHYTNYKVKGDRVQIFGPTTPSDDDFLHLANVDLDKMLFDLRGVWTLSELFGIVDGLRKKVVDSKGEGSQFGDSKPKDEGSEVKHQETEEVRKLFPLDKNGEIIEIENMFQEGRIFKTAVPPRFFDGLFYVMEKNWDQCAKVFTIHLELDASADYDSNIFCVSGVLNKLIDRSSLQALKLAYFHPHMLVDSLATLGDMDQLDYVDFSHNSLTLMDFDMLLRCIPDDTIDKIDADFSFNKIENEKYIGLFLQDKMRLQSVKIAQQCSGTLNLDKIREYVRHGDLFLE